jgi:serine protease inhibitor
MNPGASIAVISVARLNSPWLYPFKKSPTKLPFHQSDGVISTNAIISSAHCSYYLTYAFTAVEILYESEDISFVVILPTKTLAGIRRYVEQEALKPIMDALGVSTKKTKVILPAFEVATSDSIAHVFEDIGIEALFYGNSHELDGIVQGEEIVVSNMTQVILLKVDVDEAPSATTCASPEREEKEVIEVKEQEQLLVVGRPFIYGVWNRKKQIPLLTGQYNPRRYPTTSRYDITTADDIERHLTRLIQEIAIDEEDSRAIAKDVMSGLELKHVLCVDYTSDEFKAVQAGVNEIMK